MTHKTLRELWRTDRAAANAIIDAIDRGDPVEAQYGRDRHWEMKFGDSFSLDSTYRIAPRDPTIDWSQIGAEIVAFAMDSDDKWFGFYKPPTFNGERWVSISGCIHATHWPKALIPGHNIPAEKSIWLRPKEGE